ncbi:hypothetical protein [Kitasatospora albolonga]|uniref:hypothetical protein n=1 Tax=Kitasatospora albolonga TaxID=68173 RepID=UPI0031EA8BF5
MGGQQAIAAVLEPHAAEDLLTKDWADGARRRCAAGRGGAAGFTANVLTGALAAAAWLATAARR